MDMSDAEAEGRHSALPEWARILRHVVARDDEQDSREGPSTPDGT